MREQLRFACLPEVAFLFSTVPGIYEWLDSVECLARNGGEFLRGSSKLCQGAVPAVAATMWVGLDRVCARVTLPLSGAGRGL